MTNNYCCHLLIDKRGGIEALLQQKITSLYTHAELRDDAETHFEWRTIKRNS